MIADAEVELSRAQREAMNRAANRMRGAAIDPPNTIEVRTGTEGPRHDPYRYTEVTFRGRRGDVTIHGGLDNWTEWGSVRVRGEREARALFEQIAGLSPERAERLARELPYRRHARRCSGRDFRCESGYPGETFQVCVKCGDVVDSSFNISAVE